jgi:hypothetical protein
MNEIYYGCAGCGQEGGSEDDNNYCYTCGSYKYYGWLKWDCEDCGLSECKCVEVPNE